LTERHLLSTGVQSADRSLSLFFGLGDESHVVDGRTICSPLTDRAQSGFERRHMDRKTPLPLVKKYCEAAGIDPKRLGARGISIHSLRKTAINDAIRNGATMHEVREFAGHADIRTTAVYFIRKEEDAEVAARKIQIRVTGRKGE
jgi:integrase